MRSFLSITALIGFSVINAQVIAPQPAVNATPAVEVQTFSESCASGNNGSAFLRTQHTNWKLSIYYNADLLNTLSVAGSDTFLRNLQVGAYTFICAAPDGTTDTVHSIISTPAKIISACRVHYLDGANPQAVSFINLSSGAVSFAWDFGDGEQSAEISPVHNYAQAGTYTVVLKAYNRAGCESVSTYIVQVDSSETTGTVNHETGVQSKSLH